MSGSDAPRTAVLVGRECLGDALLKLPFLRAVNRAYPDHRVWWIASHQTAMADILRPFTENRVETVINHALLVEPAHEVVSRLRRLPPFTAVFDARTRIGTVLLARLFLHYERFYTCLPGFILSDGRPPGRFRRATNVAERLLSMVEAATGRPADWRGALPVGAAARAAAEALLPPGRRYVGLAPGSREAVKNWPLERFTDLAGRLAAAGHTPVFLIGPQEREWLERLRAGAPNALFPEAEHPDGLPGVHRLELAMALAERLDVAVANDSGIGHLLGAMGTPLVSLFGPTDPARWAPVSDRLRVVRAQQFGATAVEAIPVPPVLEAVEALLAEGLDGQADASRSGRPPGSSRRAA